MPKHSDADHGFQKLNLITQEQIMIKQFFFGLFVNLPAVTIGADL